jgi:hypothetical protein
MVRKAKSCRAKQSASATLLWLLAVGMGALAANVARPRRVRTIIYIPVGDGKLP